MKKFVFLFSIICLLGFSQSYSQTIPKVKVPDTVSETEQMKKLFDTPDVQEKVKEQLVKNTGLRDKALGFLKNNPETALKAAELIKKNPTSKSKVMEAVLKNPELLSSVMGFIKSNPELLQKVMKLVGM